MLRVRVPFRVLLPWLAAWTFWCSSAFALEYRGQVLTGAFPVPGATVTLSQGPKKITVLTDQSGSFYFANVSDGKADIHIKMSGFVAIDQEIVVTETVTPSRWNLVILALDQLINLSKSASPRAPPLLPRNTVATGREAPAPNTGQEAHDAANQDIDQGLDGFLINGSVNNAAASKYALDPAFGNRRPNSKSLYNGGIAFIFGNSAFDAKSYSLSGLDVPKPSYNRLTGGLTLGGPFNIPHLMPHGPTFFLGYQWTRDHTAATETGLVPTLAEQSGDLSGVVNPQGNAVTIYDPTTGLPFSGNKIPVSAQARTLLQLYPQPNIASTIAGAARYNYQIPVLNSSHQDVVQSRLEKTFGHQDTVYGGFNLQSTRAGSTNLFGFTDTTDSLGMNANIHWSHRFSQHMFLFAGYTFSRLRAQVHPWFENRDNISGTAGIEGNNQDPENWGPPALNFSSGIAALSDQQSSFNRSRTDSFSGSLAFYRGRHNLTVGGDLRKQQYNDYFQQDPRGTFSFTGAATQGSAVGSGSDLADFLLGIPDTSSIAYGNPDKYLRQPVYDLYITDDWRLLSNLTIDAGLRWEYGAPFTELHGRLVNLDVASDFEAVEPVVSSHPIGGLTGSHYPSSLIRPDKKGFEPRIGISWRPLAASSLVIRAGYGIYDDTSVYQTPTLQMAQQFPLSKSLSLGNTAMCPLTLANGFDPCSATTENTFAIDPNFRVGYAQTWQLAVQHDLPYALQLTASYLGIKGTRGVQQFLPNTDPIGETNSCAECPLGFVYQTSNGSSSRESGQLELRRRLRGGLAASAIYTYSKSIDNDAILGGQGHVSATSQSQSVPEAPPSVAAASTSAAIAQNWRDLGAERSLSSFDQRHLLNLQLQYTTGEGLTGGTLMRGWGGRLFKEWTFLSRISVGTGLPQSPVYFASVPGTGVTGTIRPDLTGASTSPVRAGLHLNPAAYTSPTPGEWGTAGRNSITGPDQFTLDASLARTFRPSSHLFLDTRIDANNMLNHGVFTGWITTINSAQFGLPLAVNPMRSVQITGRLRF